MSGDAPEGGVPASIAAIMAAIRQDVTHGAPAAAPVPAIDDAVPLAVPRESRGGTGPVSLPAGLDAEVRALLAPMLRDWLDAHLPEIVEAATRSEIRRLTGLND